MSKLKRTTSYAVIIYSLLILNSCGGGGVNETQSNESQNIPCLPTIEPGIRIEIFDKRTGLAVSCGSSATLTENNYIEALSNPDGANCIDSSMLIGAKERPGIYDIVVSKSGYVDWTATKTEVSSNVCHVNTITLQAYLDKVI